MTEISSADLQWVTDELILVEALAKELESYIIHGDVYHTLLISTANGMHKLTMSGGDLLVRLHRLREHYAALSSKQQAQFEEVENNVQRTIYALRTQFNELLRRELKARNDQLTWNVDVRHASDKADTAEIQNRQHIAAIQEALKEA